VAPSTTPVFPLLVLVFVEFFESLDRESVNCKLCNSRSSDWVGDGLLHMMDECALVSPIDKGCDVLTNHSDSYGPEEAAEERGSNFISYHSDIRELAPNVFLTGVIWNWGLIMTDVIRAVYNGTWSRYPNQDWWYGLADGGVKLAPFSDSVPDNVRNMVEEREQMIISVEFKIFEGMSHHELREMGYFEPNVVGEIP
jgi:hypothetical protein